MKKLIIVLSFILWKTVSATDHFVASSGNDANPGTILLPWKTLNKVNTSFASFASGDRVLFHRGDTFVGVLRPSKSFAVGNPLIFTSYGTGANPVISGFVDIVAWTNIGSNIWESTIAPSTLTSCNMVVIDGVNTPMGRTPNTGYYTYQTFTQTSLTSTSLNAATINWTGASAVIRKNNWIIDRDTITSASGSTIVHTSHSVATGVNNYGFFIENDLRTLDVQNEWYYSSTSKRLRIYSTTMPGTIKVATIDTLVYTKQFDNMTFDSIDFVGSNKDAIVYPGSSRITIQNCGFYYSGKDAVWGFQNYGANSATNFIFQNNIVKWTNNNVLCAAEESTNGYVGHNTIKYTGMYPGMLADGSGTLGTGEAIHYRAANTIFEWNRIDSVGYIGIFFYGSNQIIRYNFIEHALLIKADGGLIYTWNGILTGAGLPTPSPSGRKVYNNILLHSNSQSNLVGTTAPVPLVHGIYMDANDDSTEIYNNTVSEMAYGGFYNYSGSSNNNIHNNTFYNNDVGQILVIDQFNNNKLTKFDTIKNNIVVSKTATQRVSRWTTSRSAGAYLATAGLFDSNYYCRPIAEANSLSFITVATTTAYSLGGWQVFSGMDAHSHVSPFTITDTSKFKFVYNDTSIAKTYILGAIYVDMRNVTYNDSIVLQPMTSAVLLYSSALINTPPVAVAGPDQIITVTSTVVDGTGSYDTDGTIVSYLWSQLSGPTASIVSPFSPTTSIVFTGTGTRVFRLTVTDNNGATGTDNVQILVNAIPTVDAGISQTITLPTSSVTLAGTASDPDGSIASTVWSQDGGPNTASITTPSSLTSGVTGLIAGDYTLRLTATDNLGAVNSDTMHIIVLGAPANVPPTANAGTDSTTTLPRDSVHLLGHGTDTDGTITAYDWAEVSGPNSASIGTPADSNTVVTGLIAGIYTFRLRVTDNQGSSGYDTVLVTVNPFPNVPPNANAGVDQSITSPNSTLIGTASNDPDGTIVSYNWTQLSGPNTASIAFPANATTAVNGMITGTYVFQLLVTDNGSLTDTDTMQIIVAIPVYEKSILIITHGPIIFTK